MPGRGPGAPQGLPPCVLWVPAWLRDPGERAWCCVSVHGHPHVSAPQLACACRRGLCGKRLACPVSPPSSSGERGLECLAPLSCAVIWQVPLCEIPGAEMNDFDAASDGHRAPCTIRINSSLCTLRYFLFQARGLHLGGRICLKCNSPLCRFSFPKRAAFPKENRILNGSEV